MSKHLFDSCSSNVYSLSQTECYREIVTYQFIDVVLVTGVKTHPFKDNLLNQVELEQRKLYRPMSKLIERILLTINILRGAESFPWNSVLSFAAEVLLSPLPNSVVLGGS